MSDKLYSIPFCHRQADLCILHFTSVSSENCVEITLHCFNVAVFLVACKVLTLLDSLDFGMGANVYRNNFANGIETVRCHLVWQSMDDGKIRVMLF